MWNLASANAEWGSRQCGNAATTEVIAETSKPNLARRRATRADMQAYTGCVAGALTEREFRAALTDVGPTNIEIPETHRVHDQAASAIVRARWARTSELGPLCTLELAPPPSERTPTVGSGPVPSAGGVCVGACKAAFRAPSRIARYPSDLTDARWALIESLLCTAKPGDRHEAHPRRGLVNAILYLLRTGCSWRQLPKDFPPWETVYWHFARWRDDGSLDALHDALRERVREAEGRQAQPTAAIIDAQSVKGADTVARATRGYDAGKKINGRKRHTWSP